MTFDFMAFYDELLLEKGIDQSPELIANASFNAKIEMLDSLDSGAEMIAYLDQFSG